MAKRGNSSEKLISQRHGEKHQRVMAKIMAARMRNQRWHQRNGINGESGERNNEKWRNIISVMKMA